MNETERLAEIQRRLTSNEYFVNPLSDANVQKDVEFLLVLLAQKDQKIADLEKKNKTLSAHAMELSQEMENIRSDFNNDMR